MWAGPGRFRTIDKFKLLANDARARAAVVAEPNNIANAPRSSPNRQRAEPYPDRRKYFAGLAAAYRNAARMMEPEPEPPEPSPSSQMFASPAAK
jgi:hypothetical protein